MDKGCSVVVCQSFHELGANLRSSDAACLSGCALTRQMSGSFVCVVVVVGVAGMTGMVVVVGSQHGCSNSPPWIVDAVVNFAPAGLA